MVGPMSALAGPFFAAALLLAVAGAIKVGRPAATRVALRSAGLPDGAVDARLLGVVELAIAVLALAVGGRTGAGLVALAYLGFAGFSLLVMRRARGRASCGCFGSSDAPLGVLHVVIDGLLAAVALVLVASPVRGLLAEAGDTPLAGVPFVGLVLLIAWLVQVSLTTLPALLAARQPPAPAATVRIGGRP